MGSIFVSVWQKQTYPRVQESDNEIPFQKWGRSAEQVVHILAFCWKKFNGAKNNRPLFFKTIGYCFYCSFYCFFENFRRQTPFREGKSRFGGAPLPPPPRSRKPALGAGRSKKLSDMERITRAYHFWNWSVPARNRHRNCAGLAGSNVNRRPIRYVFRGAPIIDP